MDTTITVINFLAIFRPELLDVNIFRDHVEERFHALEIERNRRPHDPVVREALQRAAEMLDTLNGVSAAA